MREEKAHREFETYDKQRRIAADTELSDFDEFVNAVNKQTKKRMTKKKSV